MLRSNKNLTDLTKSKKRISLPLNHSFNGCIVKDKTSDGYILSFRINNSHDVYNLINIKSVVTDKIGVCKLDKNFRCIPKSLFILKYVGYIDGRLCWYKDKLLLTYTNDTTDKGMFGTIIMDTAISNDFIETENFRISPEETSDLQKNWTNFVYNDELYFIKNINPHKIYKFNLETKQLTSVSNLNWENKWFYNLSLRGNTNPIKLPDNNYLSTFHTVQHMVFNDTRYRFYDNGFYIFEGKPPFKPLKMMTQTFLPAESCDLIFSWEETPYSNSSKQKFYCTFPIGMMLDGDDIIVSYGNSDKFIDVGKYSLKEIMNLMKDI